MGLRDYTKQLFANTLEDMMRTTPLQKIRVKDLCGKCGAERQSFYYHFKDKYDLTAWIFMQDYQSSLLGENDLYNEEHVVRILQKMKDKGAFYKTAFADQSQNAVQQYIVEYFTKLGEDRIIQGLGEDAMTTEARFAVRSHSFACLGHTVEWLNGKSDYTPEEFARLQYQFMPDILKRAYGISQNAAKFSDMGGASE